MKRITNETCRVFVKDEYIGRIIRVRVTEMKNNTLMGERI